MRMQFPVTATPHQPHRSRPLLRILLTCGAAIAIAATGVKAVVQADVAPHLHRLAITSVPAGVFSARVVYYPTNNQFARNSVVSECFGGLQPGNQYRFPDILVIADDNNNARLNALRYNTSIQGFSDTHCGNKYAYCELLVEPNTNIYWWVDESVRWYSNA